MKSTLIKSLVITLTLIFLAMPSVLAESIVPKLINYQGKLTDDSGNPLPNGTYGVAFRVWSKKAAPEIGDQLIWGQEYNVAFDSDPRLQPTHQIPRTIRPSWRVLESGN